MRRFWPFRRSPNKRNLEVPTCTYCDGTRFYEGPRGGMSVNILCANDKCRHWFNYHRGFIPMDDLHRIEPL